MTVSAGQKITGRISCAPNAKNNRDLDIAISYQTGQDAGTNIQYKMCVLLSVFPSPFSPRAATTSPRALRLRLIFCVSFNRSLSLPAPLLLSLSDPARSTKLRDPLQDSPDRSFVPVIRRVKTEWERDERDEERDCLSFLNGRATAFTPFWTVFLRDAALPETSEDFVEEVSVDFAMMDSSNNTPLTDSNLYFVGPNF